MRIQSFFLFISLVGVLIRPLPAQSIEPDVLQKIDSLFAPWNSHPSLGVSTPGIVLGIVHRGKLIHQKAYGMDDVAKKEPLSVGHSFWVASVAKQFTATAIALLAEAGKLSLEDDIRRYLPEIPFLGDTVRIRHLIYHTSGLRDGFTLIGLDLKGEKHYTNENVLRYLSHQQALNFKPGERHEYNNGGYVLLAEIVARVSGQPFREYLQTHIFQPLGMGHSAFYGHFGQEIPQLATGYTVNYKHGKVRYKQGHFKGHTVGSSGLVTTLEDLYRWDQNFYQNRLGNGSPTLLQLLTKPGRLNDGSIIPYAFGLEVEDYRGVPVMTHSGVDPGYKAEIARFPQQALTVICLANTGDVYNLTAKLLKIGEWMLPEAFPQEPNGRLSSPDSIPLAPLTGIYLNPVNLADVRVVSVQKNQTEMVLYAARSTEGYREPLQTVGPDKFVNQGTGEIRYYFERGEEGSVQTLQYKERANAYAMEKVRTIALSRNELQLYAGKYYCPELNRYYRLTIKRGKLGLSLFHLLHIPFLPLEGNRFLADLIGNNSLQFTKDKDGRVTGFRFSRESVKELTFYKK